MVEEKRIMEVTHDDFAIIINALMNMRRNMIQEQKQTDLIDKVIKATITARAKPKGIFHKKRRVYETR